MQRSDIVNIVPAILSSNVNDFLERVRQAESFTDYVQIDIMDGIFVPSRSLPIEVIGTVNTTLSFEIHLMVQDPIAFMERIDHRGLRKALFHVESMVEPYEFIAAMKERGIDVGVAIKPETGIEDFMEVAASVDTLLFLAVDPGFYGSPFRTEVMGKIAKVRQMFQDKVISVDGGVSLENLNCFLELGVDSVCVGSRIFLNGDPQKNYMLFKEKVTELTAKESFRSRGRPRGEGGRLK